MIAARPQRKEEDTSGQHNERGWDNADTVRYLQRTGVVIWKAPITKLSLSEFAPPVLAHLAQQQEIPVISKITNHT
jgi:hypothetical protein